MVTNVGRILRNGLHSRFGFELTKFGRESIKARSPVCISIFPSFLAEKKKIFG